MAAPLFEHLFDISPFPAVVSRLRDKAVLAINRRTSEMFGIAHADALELSTTDYYVNPEDRQLLAGRWSATAGPTTCCSKSGIRRAALSGHAARLAWSSGRAGRRC